MNKIQYIGIKEDGRPFRVVNRALLDQELTALPKGRYSLTVEKYRKNKSNPQLGYLFAVVYPLFLRHLNEAGYEFTNVDQVDAFCKSQFANQEIINRNTGEIINIPDLKRSFTTVSMMTYIDAIRNWDAEYLGGTIPEPETQLTAQFI